MHEHKPFGSAYEHTFTEAMAVEWRTVVRDTEAIADLAPWAILAPFVGLFVGYQLARFFEAAGARWERRAYTVWAKRSW